MAPRWQWFDHMSNLDASPIQPKLRRKREPLRAMKIAAQLVAAAADPLRPMVTHLVITRRCNLSCGYCFEYDKVSKPVPTGVLKQRLDHLARLRSIFVVLTGGESLLHPDVIELVRYAREIGLTPFLNTNGYLLTKDIIDGLDAAGLYGMQLSIDNARPNEVSKKSLKPLMTKLRLLARHARFHVRINTVLGASPPAEALEVAKTVVAFGFDSNCSLVRDETGALITPDPETRAAYDEIRSLGRRLPSFMDDDYTQQLLDHGTMSWKCRAGARTFLVDEYGLVHLCQPRMGDNPIPLLAYTVEHIRQAFYAPKPCAKTCPIAYAHHASKLDGWRSQNGAPLQLSAPPLPAASTGRRSPALAVVG
ncbi:MAG TPA: radical SAM protein [Kofleriaceae bacterium]|jgi:MoaA/NifB/PqqE/SkfB family radical SAM enzyme|nr:radical SAM protein [Kofleriaceae bacterium]